jgi:polysaccharide pyruvyl transferase WcaK-like protein
VVVSQEVLAHVDDQRKYLQVAANVLRPGGYLIVTTANKFVMDRLGPMWDSWPPEHIENFVDMKGLKQLLAPRFRVLRTTTVIPIGGGGILRLVNSNKLNKALSLLIPDRYLETRKRGPCNVGRSMAGQRRVKRIGILGHVGTKNLGDEAIIAAVIQKVRDRYPDAEIIGFTGNPEDTLQRHGITAFPIRGGERRRGSPAVSQPGKLARPGTVIQAAGKASPGLRAILRGMWKGARLFKAVLEEPRSWAQCYHRLKGIDLLIVAGSNQLNDYFGGPWAFPYDLLKWCVLARWVRAKVAIVCCGAGPLRSRLGRLFVKYSLSLADYRSYRDKVSRRLIESIGVPGDDPVCTDLAHGLWPLPPAKPNPATARLTVGINPLPFFDERYWPEHNSDVYQHYVRKLALFAAWLHQHGHRVVFFPTQLRADPPVIRDVRGLLNTRAANFETLLVDSSVASVDDLLRRIATVDIVVASRYHGVVFAALLHKPVLAISYYEKTRDLMAQIGQADYVVDINAFDTDSLAERFLSMQSRTKTIRQEIQQRTRVLRRALEREYDHVFRLLEHPNPVPVDERVGALARLNGHV